MHLTPKTLRIKHVKGTPNFISTRPPLTIAKLAPHLYQLTSPHLQTPSHHRTYKDARAAADALFLWLTAHPTEAATVGAAPPPDYPPASPPLHKTATPPRPPPTPASLAANRGWTPPNRSDVVVRLDNPNPVNVLGSKQVEYAGAWIVRVHIGSACVAVAWEGHTRIRPNGLNKVTLEEVQTWVAAVRTV